MLKQQEQQLQEVGRGSTITHNEGVKARVNTDDVRAATSQELVRNAITDRVVKSTNVRPGGSVTMATSTMGGIVSPQKVNMEQLQEKAQKLVEQRISRVEHVQQEPIVTDKREHIDYQEDEARPSGQSMPYTRIQHLKKLNLVSKDISNQGGQGPAAHKGGDMDQQSITEGNYNPLRTTHRFNYDDMGEDMTNNKCLNCVNCNSGRMKVKSGKYAKTGVNIVKQESWPHNAVS